MSNEIFEIWQLVQDESTAQLRWMSSDYLAEKGLALDLANYEQKYRAARKPDDTLGRIFQRFNIERPEDFHGHSLSVSDLIVIRQGAGATVFYVDRFGFKDVTDEIKSAEKLDATRRPHERKPFHDVLASSTAKAEQQSRIAPLPQQHQGKEYGTR